MKPTLKWINENIQVTGLSITIDDNSIGSQFVTMTHADEDVISEINDCLLDNFPAYYDHISYGSCDDADMEVNGYYLKVTVWTDNGHKTLKEQMKEKKGFRFNLGDVYLIKSTPNMISNSIEFDYKNNFYSKSEVEILGIDNCKTNWDFFKSQSEKYSKSCECYAYDVLYQHWEEVDGEYVEIIVPFEDSMPYLYRYNKTGLPLELR